MKKRIKDEVIITALLEQGSIRAAASALGIGEATIYKRKKDEAFTAKYNEAKAECVKAATGKLQYVSLSAANTLTAIMEDPETAPQIRINAANAVLNYTAKFTETADILERLAKLEGGVNNGGY